MDKIFVYRIYTENTGGNVSALTERYFKGATISNAIGVWQGVREDALIVEIIGSETDLQSVIHLAGDIKHVNNQQAVLVTAHQVTSLLL